MFKKILIVNCGEIVVCIICVVCEMGILIVVIYLEVDKELLYIILVDEVICVGLVKLVEFYLNVNVILFVVIVIGVEVVYLGFGFLSENFKFVIMCEEMNLKFIGLFGEVMDKMGDKINVCIEMIKVDVLVILGLDG